MKVIVSAFVAGQTPEQHAAATAALIGQVAEMQYAHQLAQGVYNGTNEVVLVITGFKRAKELLGVAERLRKAFKQETVYVELAGTGSLVGEDGMVTTIGPEIEYSVHMVATPLFRRQTRNYTLLPNGSALVAHTALELAA